MHDPFFIVGQTAAGKTAAAVFLAERCGGEIVNADAFQVYAGLDLLTAKPAPAELARVRHHLVGTVPLGEAYNVARFRDDALAAIADIQARGKRVFVVGGSGLYVKALTHGLSPLPPAAPELRAELEALAESALLARLRALDPVSADAIDARNRRRLVRALEVCLTTGEPFSKHRDLWTGDVAPAGAAGVFLFRDRLDLHGRIEARVAALFAADVLAEVRALPAELPGPTAAGIIGLADIRAYLAGRLPLATCRKRIEAATRQYAKRQQTWFRRETLFRPVNLTHDRFPFGAAAP